MFPILVKRTLAKGISLLIIKAPRIAASAKPGQFVIVRNDEKGERIPLTISDFNVEEGTVTLVIQEVGASSRKICRQSVGAVLPDVVGPLGRPSEFVEMTPEVLSQKRFLFIAGGVGTAPVYPQAKYLFEKGASVDVIVGAKNHDMMIMEEEMKAVCTNLYPCTDDGSYGFHGLVTACFEALMAEGKHYDHVVAIGPMIMMKFVAKTVKPYNIPLVVSLNTLMVDGTGMCGACRVTVGGKTKFACVDGPEFDGYEVDFDEAMRRQGQYRAQEIEADERDKRENAL